MIQDDIIYICILNGAERQFTQNISPAASLFKSNFTSSFTSVDQCFTISLYFAMSRCSISSQLSMSPTSSAHAINSHLKDL